MTNEKLNNIKNVVVIIKFIKHFNFSLNFSFITGSSEKENFKMKISELENDYIEIVKPIGYGPNEKFTRPLYDYEGYICIQK